MRLINPLYILWHDLTNFLLVTFFQWRCHVILCLKKFVFRLFLTLYQGKRLFFISAINLGFLITLKKQHYEQLLVYVFLSTTKIFLKKGTFLPSFISFSWRCMFFFFNQTQFGPLFNLEIYKAKKSLF